MTGGDWGSIASALVAFAALILSWISLSKTSRFNRRQDELAATTEALNRLLIERETQAGQDSKRADLSANLITVGKSNWRLKVFNRGKGTARNVRLAMISLKSATSSTMPRGGSWVKSLATRLGQRTRPSSSSSRPCLSPRTRDRSGAMQLITSASPPPTRVGRRPTRAKSARRPRVAVAWHLRGLRG
jgi:hypothetical protein